MFHFRSPPSTISHSYLQTDPLPSFPNGTHKKTDTHLQTLLHPIPWKFIFLPETPVRERPPCSPTGSLWKEIHHYQSQWSIYSCMSQISPKKEDLYNMGKNIRSPPTETHADERPTYSWDAVWYPNGTVVLLLLLPCCVFVTVGAGFR